MKNIFKISGIILITILFYSCEEKATPPALTTTAVTEISTTTAKSGGVITDNGRFSNSISFDIDVPYDIRSYFRYEDGKYIIFVRDEEILASSKNKEDIERLLKSKEFNL